MKVGTAARKGDVVKKKKRTSSHKIAKAHRKKKKGAPVVHADFAREKPRTDMPLEKRVDRKYNRLMELTRGVAGKFLSGLAVSGERGLGKSYTIAHMLEEYAKERTVRKITGHISPLMVYNTLSDNRDEDCIIWFDDCDNAFTDATAMNILKAAMDTNEPRIVSWATTSRLAETPDFRFRGRVIISTNVKLGKSPHLAAFLDRIQWCNMFLTLDEKVYKIGQIAKSYPDTPPEIVDGALDWIKTHKERIGDLLSLRTFVKIVQLAKFSPNWPDLALAMIEETEEVLGESETVGEATEREKKKRGSKKDNVAQFAAAADRSKAQFRGEYKEGSLSKLVFDLMRDGRRRSLEEIEKNFKTTKDRAQLPAVLARIKRHGTKSGGQFSMEEIDGGTAWQMITG